MKLSIIICTYNRAIKLKDALLSISRAVKPPNMDVEIILVNNNCTDNTQEVIKQFSDTEVFNTISVKEINQGISYARNSGIEKSSGEILAFIDDDIIMHDGWMKAINNAVNNYPDYKAFGGRILPTYDFILPTWLKKGPYLKIGGPICAHDYGECIVPYGRDMYMPNGANMIFHKEVFQKYGLFNTKVGRIGNNLLSGEDTDLFQRIQKNRESILYVGNAVLYHPIEECRATDSYFHEWYFAVGRSFILYANIPDVIPTFYGKPAFLIKGLFFATAKKLYYRMINNSGKSHFWKMQQYFNRGAIYEYRQQHLQPKGRDL